MAERERRIRPPFGGVFVARTQVLDADDVRRALWRMAHEIVEHNHGLEDVVLIGLQTGGVAFMAHLGGFVFGLLVGFLAKGVAGRHQLEAPGRLRRT